MTAKSALLTVLLSIIGFAVLGICGSLLVNSLLPDYYRSAFRLDANSSIPPAALGMQLGALQGAGLGVVFALGMLALAAMKSPRQSPSVPTSETTVAPVTGKRHWGLLWFLTTGCLIFVCSSLTLFVGMIIGELQYTQRLTAQKLEVLDQLIAENSYPDLESDYSSAAQVYLVGSVKTRADYQSLKQQLVITFGTAEAKNMIRLVDVQQADQ
ncbi:hypothetical protein [Gimesia sp.]|uniref:hypothetical protein n=1 Tax=Gimesia sp. TaxID=2024833 RepID=UPI0032EF28B1